MEEAFSNIIRNKYKELIHHISLIGDETKIEDRWSKLSLTIDVYKDKKRLLSFKLYKLSETDNTLEVAWGVLGRDIGHWSLPDYFDQDYMFDRLILIITNWYNDIINCNLDKVLEQTKDIKEKIKKTFIKDWTLIDFAKEFGSQMKVGISTNHHTGEKFPNCMFINKESNVSTYVGFYSQLGALTSEQIAKRRNKLFVGLKKYKGKKIYYLHAKDIIKYEEIDLNLTPKELKENQERELEKNASNSSFTDGHLGIDYLSIEQKYALLSRAYLFGTSTQTLQNKENEVTAILEKFRDVLRLNYFDAHSQKFNQFNCNKELCNETIKTIELDGPFILLITYCMQLMGLDTGDSILCEFFSLLINIGYTGEEALSICSCNFVFRFDKKE